MYSTITITVLFMSVARQRAGAGSVELTCRESTLKAILKEIVAAYGLADLFLSEKGEVRPWARVLVNGRSHDLVGGLDVELHDGDRVALIYPYTENF
jgi:molybdopterin converting factor small subunit